MKALPPPGVLIVLLLAASPVLPAQDGGMWRAASTSAKGVTGDISFTETKVILNFSGYTLAQIRSLQPDEAKALFGDAGAGEGTGNLYRTEIPAEKRFAHKNTLCGAEQVQWIATYVSGKSLHTAMFSGASMPKLTAEAVADTTSLCGTYTYVR